MKLVLTGCFLSVMLTAAAQTDSIKKNWSLSGYTEVYYATNFHQIASLQAPAYFYSYNRLHEVNLNLGYVKTVYQTAAARASIAFAAGTYMNANLAAEPGVLKHIFEASAGISLSKKKNIWLDAGIFPSHIGFESAVGKDNATLTRSILAENSPYYETGVKLTFNSKSGNLLFALLALNRWQRIQRAEGNTTPAAGHQLTIKLTDKTSVNSSSFIGNDKPDSIKQLRCFHNFYLLSSITEKIKLTAGFDIGAEQADTHSKTFNYWYAPVLIVRMQPSARYTLAARAEYYSDKKGSIIAPLTIDGTNILSFSANFDYRITEDALWRMEARCFFSKNRGLAFGAPVSGSIFQLTTALSVAF